MTTINNYFHLKIKGVSVIVFDKDKNILLIKRRDVPIWALPGGTPELNETFEETANRETKEETGYDVKIIKKGCIYVRPFWKNGEKKATFLAEIIGGTAQINSEASAVNFFSVNSLPKRISKYTREIIKDAFESELPEYKIQDVSYKKMIKEFFSSFDFILIYFGLKFLIKNLKLKIQHFNFF